MLTCLQQAGGVGRLGLDLCSSATSSCLQADLAAATGGTAGQQHPTRCIAMQRTGSSSMQSAQRKDYLSHRLPVPVQVSLNKVVDHVFDIMAHLVKKKVTLEKNLAPDLPHIIADGSRVVQASCPALAARTVLFMAIILHVMPVACANHQHTEQLVLAPGAVQPFGEFR